MFVAFERLSSEFMALECVQAMFIVSVEFQKRLSCHLCVVVVKIRRNVPKLNLKDNRVGITVPM